MIGCLRVDFAYINITKNALTLLFGMKHFLRVAHMEIQELVNIRESVLVLFAGCNFLNIVNNQ